LLDDPYAAVRCVAERSMKRVSNLLPTNYDYSLAPESRPLVSRELWERWSRETLATERASGKTFDFIRADNLPATQQNFERLMRVRDERPLRLRE